MTSEELVARLDSILPGFRLYVQSPDNLFDADTMHGVFAACSMFVREHPVSNESWGTLAALISGIVGGDDIRLGNAACTCFLWNLALPGHPLRTHLQGEALAYWLRWESAEIPERGVSGATELESDYPFAAVCTCDQALLGERDGVLVAAEPGERDDWLLTVGKTYVILGEKLGMYIVVNNTGSTSLHPKPFFRQVVRPVDEES